MKFTVDIIYCDMLWFWGVVYKLVVPNVLCMLWQNLTAKQNLYCPSALLFYPATHGNSSIIFIIPAFTFGLFFLSYHCLHAILTNKLCLWNFSGSFVEYIRLLSSFFQTDLDSRASIYLRKELLRIYDKEKTCRERLWRNGILGSSPMSPRKQPEHVGTEEVFL